MLVETGSDGPGPFMRPSTRTLLFGVALGALVLSALGIGGAAVALRQLGFAREASATRAQDSLAALLLETQEVLRREARLLARDPALVEGITLVNDLGAHHEVAWLSGRPEWLRSVTRDWLGKHGLPHAEIHLRGNSDRRPARLFKLAVLRDLRARSIAAFVDDDTEVVQAAITAGYPAILADWVPRASSLREAQDWLGRA